MLDNKRFHALHNDIARSVLTPAIIIDMNIVLAQIIQNALSKALVFFSNIVM
jgi:hypothetical protein